MATYFNVNVYVGSMKTDYIVVPPLDSVQVNITTTFVGLMVDISN